MFFRLTLVVIGLFMSVNTMASAPSLGAAVDNFKLEGHDGKQYELGQFKGKLVVLEWYNNGCPFVRKHYDSGNMQKLQKKFTDQGVVWLSVVSSAEGKQGHLANAAEAKSMLEKEKSMATALLLDAKGTVGGYFEAKTTPHMFIVDKEGKLAYEGAIDSMASADAADIPKSVNYVDEALGLLIAGNKIKSQKTKPYGCGVKY